MKRRRPVPVTEEEMAEKASIRVAAVQIAPDLETLGGTVSKVLAAIAEAAEKGARLVVFPETFVPWYPYFSFVHAAGSERRRAHPGSMRHAVVVPSPADGDGGVAARPQGWRRLWCSESTNAITARSTTSSSCSTPTAELEAQAPQDHADLSRADDLGTGRRLQASPSSTQPSAGSARSPVGSTIIPSPATR